MFARSNDNIESLVKIHGGIEIYFSYLINLQLKLKIQVSNKFNQ